MIKAVIFDCFGVLVRDGWLPFKEKYFGNNAELLLEASDLNKQVDAGLISYANFIEQVAAMAKLTSKDAHQQIEDNPADERLFAYIRDAVKPHYKIGMLSNAGDNWLSELFTAEQLQLFDATALSCEIGVIKPDPLAYQMIADRLGVQPSECLFIDDQPRYCQGAREVGMQAIDYTNYDDFVKTFELASK